MHERAGDAPDLAALSKPEFYADLVQSLQGLLAEQRNWVSNTSNAAALIYHGLLARKQTQVNWVGFYVKNNADEELILGPFQGEVACVIIPPGKGVCGASAKRRETVLVPNVHEFPGHIACSSKTNSEIVVPLVKRDGAMASAPPVRVVDMGGAWRWQSLIGVLDLDAMNLNGFDEEDQKGLEKLAAVIIDACDWPQW